MTSQNLLGSMEPVLAMKTRVFLLAGIAALATAVTGCGGSGNGAATAGSGGSQIRTVPESAIVRAADVTSSEKGYAFSMRILESLPNSVHFTVAGTGTYSAASHGGTTNLTFAGEGAHYSMQAVVLGPRVYVKLPTLITAKLPGHKPWLELDYSKLPKGTFLSSLGSVSDTSETSPTMYLDYLKAETSDLRDLGRAPIAGVPTTHYRAVLNLKKAGTGLPASSHAAIQNMLKKLPGTISNESAIPVEVWVDGSQRIRKMTMSMQLVPKGTSTTINASYVLAINDYGPQTTPTAPPADQTTDLIALLRSEGKLSRLGG